MNYKDLDEKELTAILRCYDSSIRILKKMEHLNIFDVFYINDPPRTYSLDFLDAFILDKKIQYRDMRLDLMLK